MMNIATQADCESSSDPASSLSCWQNMELPVAYKIMKVPSCLARWSFFIFASLTLTTLAVTLGSDSQSVPYLYCVIFFTGLARKLLSPASVALLAHIMPRELYANAAPWDSVGWQGASVIGAAPGGIVYGFFGLAGACALDATLVELAA